MKTAVMTEIDLVDLLPKVTRPIEERAAEDLGMQLSPRLRTLVVGEPPQDRANIKVASVRELLEALATHGLLP